MFLREKMELQTLLSMILRRVRRWEKRCGWVHFGREAELQRCSLLYSSLMESYQISRVYFLKPGVFLFNFTSEEARKEVLSWH